VTAAALQEVLDAADVERELPILFLLSLLYL
jgi:hypothetical protein